MFNGFLRLADRCDVCDLDFAPADSGDGPAVFVMFLVGALTVPAALFLELTVAPPIWLHMAIWIPVSVALSLAFLRPFKATLIALQFRHDASEARFDV